MTSLHDSRPGGSDADEALLADLFDTLLQDLQDGRTPDPETLLPARPDLRARVRETWELACSVAGRREPGRPVLGGYEIVRELGHGGMGTVYLARHEALDRQVAIKVLPQSLALSQKAKRRFLEEARALARLRHDNIVHIHRIVDHSEMLAFEMEYVEGPSLQQLLVELRQHGPRPLPEHLQGVLGSHVGALGVRSTVEYFVKLGIAIARALAEVHRRGLVHRDVKPSNILLRKNGTPVLADFGLARDGDLTATQTVSFAGTPIYAAPERLRDGDLGLDGRADVYSLGVTLYEAITLSPPYQGRSTEELLRKIESGLVVPLRHRAPHVSRDLQTVLQKAMEADPRHRYATAGDFADDLERLLALQPIHARPKGPLRRLTLALNRHRKVLFAAVAGAALVTTAVWPIVAHAEAAATAGERAAQSVHQAHLQLLEPQCLDLVGWTDDSQTGNASVELGAQIAALKQALADYDAALQATPDDVAVQRERAVVDAVLWLRTEMPSRSDYAAATRAEARFRQLVAPLPPVTAAAVAMLMVGDLALTTLQPQMASAGADDRFCLGLLAGLLGDLAVCEAAWLPLDGSNFAHPLLDAGLGRLYAADGFAERAYPRFFHARRTFPTAEALSLELADAALATGDVSLAEQWLAQSPAVTPPAADDHSVGALRRRRLAADLLSAKGEQATAEAAYREILKVWPRDRVARHRLAVIASAHGDLARAREYLRRIVGEHANDAEAHLDLARLAVHMADRAAYLDEARAALTLVRQRQLSRGKTAMLLQILQLGGLQGLLDELADRDQPMRDWRQVSTAPRLWKSPGEQLLVERGLRWQSEFDLAWLRGHAAESHPVRAATRSATGFVLDHLGLLQLLPDELVRWLAVGWPLGTEISADIVNVLLLPMQRSLGDPLFAVRITPIGRSAPIAQGFDYARSIATVGFLDGTEDLLVATVPRRDTAGTGHVEIRSSIAAEVRDRLDSPRSGLMFGHCLADLGDVDGDGLRDFAVGAPQTKNDAELAAAVFVYSGRDRHLLQELRGTDNVAFGTALAPLGDVDGDGVPDLAVGTAPFRRSTMALGSVTVFSGKQWQVLRVHYGDRPGAWFGGSMSPIGDLDGDGVRDLVVGGNLGGSTPLVRVFSGRAGTELLTIEERGHSDFGRTVLGVSDLDGDGTDDIAVTAPDLDNRDQAPGKVLLFSGRTGDRIAELHGDDKSDHFGIAICTLPDWRGDHRPAIAIGANSGGVSGNGYVRVFDAASRKPLQSFYTSPDRLAFGFAVTALSDHDSLGRPRLCNLGIERTHEAQLWTVYYNLDQPDATRPR